MENNFEATTQLPPQLSTLAPDVDWLFYFIFWVSVVFFVGIVGALVYFMVRYRRQPGVKAEPTGHHNALELFWTFSPLIILFLMFHWGYQTYIVGAIAPDDAINIRVRGRQWAWSFEHPNGYFEDHTLHVPAGRPIRLILSSDDVIHSFFVPDFRVKRDAVPGMFTALWFQAVERPDIDLGDVSEPSAMREWYRAQVYCTEYCGAGGGWETHAGHATMLADIVVQREEDYNRLMAEGPPPPTDEAGNPLTPVAWGERLFAEKGCTACHQRNAAGPSLAGPNFYGPFWGRSEALASGDTVTIDEDYVRTSILRPRDQVVAGYEPVMPNIRMSDRELEALVAYLQTL